MDFSRLTSIAVLWSMLKRLSPYVIVLLGILDFLTRVLKVTLLCREPVIVLDGVVLLRKVYGPWEIERL